MRALHAMERRLQDLERKFQNKERLGKITDVKFEKDRWYVKLNDGQDQTPSGDDSKASDTFKSDWQPWQSFSHGTIKMSVPPKKGQHALMRAVGGIPELATIEPFHYGPDTPSPHGKEDEVVKLIHEDDSVQHWKHQTKDTHHLIIKKKSQDGAAGAGGLGDLGGLGGLGGLGDLGGLGNLSTMMGSLGNITNISALGNLTSGLGDINGLIGGLGLGDLSKFGDLNSLGNLQNLINTSSTLDLSKIAGAFGGQSALSNATSGGAGAGGGSSQYGMAPQTQAKEAPKLPDVPEEGDDSTTQVKSTADAILKTVGKNKSFYKQDKDTVHIRFGEQDAKADVLMDEKQVKVQFKDKKAMVKWTENDLTTQMGEDDKSKVVMTEDSITMTQGGEGATSVKFTKDDLTISQGGSTSWKMSNGKIEIGVGGTSWTLDASGWTQTGGNVAHDGKLIDSTHKHDGVMPGGGLTGLPAIPSGGAGV
jgi:hypothetical protein